MDTIRQRTIRFLGRSHLSPDGGSFTRAASTAWQRMATVKEQKEKGLLLHPPLTD
jgi:cytochrome c556